MLRSGLVKSGFYAADHHILGLIREIGIVEIAEVIILDSEIEWTTG
jgi:hypothetical protein